MKHNYQPKPLFIERMKELLGETDYGKYEKAMENESPRSIRVNTLKITISKLKKRLEEKSWILNQPFKDYPEIIIIENELQPGELGRSIEHLLGYYYVQEIASMLPAIVLNPKRDEIVLDLCAAPGSKTTQMAMMMENKGTIIANDAKLDRIKILASNLERCGVTNTILTRRDGISLCNKIAENNKKGGDIVGGTLLQKGGVSVRGTLVPLMFDKILVDAPCSGEGTIRSSPKTLLMWNINTVKSLSKLQKKLLESAFEILKPNGELVYSTCTHAPEENEEVLDFILKKFKNVKIEKILVPVKCREGIEKWQEKEYSKDVRHSCRIYPQITNTDGFFISKLRKTK